MRMPSASGQSLQARAKEQTEQSASLWAGLVCTGRSLPSWAVKVQKRGSDWNT